MVRLVKCDNSMEKAKIPLIALEFDLVNPADSLERRFWVIPYKAESNNKT